MPLLVPCQKGSGAACKADLRAWVLVLDWNPLVVFAHPEVYFRVATRPYAFNGPGQAETFAHATNCRDEDNRCTLQTLLESAGGNAKQIWKEQTWPQLLDGVRAVLLAVRDRVEGAHLEFERKRRAHDRGSEAGPRQDAFELFGFDFAID